jgi:hypothetical protein
MGIAVLIKPHHDMTHRSTDMSQCVNDNAEGQYSPSPTTFPTDIQIFENREVNLDFSKSSSTDLIEASSSTCISTLRFSTMTSVDISVGSPVFEEARDKVVILTG